jgi:hypothetical protein
MRPPADVHTQLSAGNKQQQCFLITFTRDFDLFAGVNSMVSNRMDEFKEMRLSSQTHFKDTPGYFLTMLIASGVLIT